MTPVEVASALEVLRNLYADRAGVKPALNDAQRAAWIDTLSPFPAVAMEAAVKAWVRRSAFFPRPSDIFAILRPNVAPETEAHLAWATLERAITSAGRYRGARFVDGAVGETTRQVFGSWGRACMFDYDSPGWAIRRQTFLATYPTIAARWRGGAVALRGDHHSDHPLLVAHVDGLSETAGALADGTQPLTTDEAKSALSRLTLALEARESAGRRP